MGNIACRHMRSGPACGEVWEEASEDTGPWSQSRLRELVWQGEAGRNKGELY